MDFPSQVKIREVGPRDGFQSINDFIPTEEKLQIIRSLVNAGISEMETTSFASPKAIAQFRDAVDVLRLAPRKGIVHSAMVFNRAGAGIAIASGANRLVVVVSATESHNQKNVGRPISESIFGLDAIFQEAKPHLIPVTGAIAVCFGCPYEGEVPVNQVFNIAETYVAKGADAVILADTTGMGVPTSVRQMVPAFRDRFPETELILHFHNNRGTAMANLLSGLMSGVNIFDTALGGIGGCPYVPQASGNIPTEDAVFMLEEMGIETGVELEALISEAQLLEKRLGKILPGQVMKSGPIFHKKARVHP